MGGGGEVMVASRPRVSFWPDGSTSPGNYGSECYFTALDFSLTCHSMVHSTQPHCPMGYVF
jgi:hypothetical protein